MDRAVAYFLIAYGQQPTYASAAGVERIGHPRPIGTMEVLGEHEATAKIPKRDQNHWARP